MMMMINAAILQMFSTIRSPIHLWTFLLCAEKIAQINSEIKMDE